MVARRRAVAAVTLVALVTGAAALVAWGVDRDDVTSTSGDPARAAVSAEPATRPPPVSRAARLGPPETALLPDMRSHRGFELSVAGAGPDRRRRFQPRSPTTDPVR